MFVIYYVACAVVADLTPDYSGVLEYLLNEHNKYKHVDLYKKHNSLVGWLVVGF